MKARLVEFGRLEIDGRTYRKDVVIDGGEIRQRDKSPTKELVGKVRHTPLSQAEAIPWGGRRLVVGTGARGQLRLTPELRAEAALRGIEIDELPTEEACLLLDDLAPGDIHAILHVTC